MVEINHFKKSISWFFFLLQPTTAPVVSIPVQDAAVNGTQNEPSGNVVTSTDTPTVATSFGGRQGLAAVVAALKSENKASFSKVLEFFYLN